MMLDQILHPADHHTTRITKAAKIFVKKLVFLKDYKTKEMRSNGVNTYPSTINLFPNAIRLNKCVKKGFPQFLLC